jgi:signal transduction histidine kinase
MTVERPPASARPVARTSARIAVALHVSLFIVAIPAAAFTAIPPVSLRWLVPVMTLLGLWLAIFTVVALRRGLVAWLVVADIAVTGSVCLLIGHLVPVDRIMGGSSWVAILATQCVVSAQLAWAAWVSVPAGFVVAVAYLIGSQWAGSPGGGYGHTVNLVIQSVATAAVMVVVRRANRLAEAAQANAHRVAEAAEVERVRRADERAQLRLLHDTVLSTLTMVGCGAIAGQSQRLRERAAADLVVIDGLPDVAATTRGGTVRLDLRLDGVVRALPIGLRVRVELEPCEVPIHVAEAMARGTMEALTNVARHAGVGDATVRLNTESGRVVVEVADAGRGFEPALVPTSRYGVRESLGAGLADAGVRASVDTAPGAGTRWTLEWPNG